jgi:peptidoglycan hydrolase-like protein with peptidoglycan-binding domain
MKGKMKPVLVLATIFGFVLMLMNASMVFAQQQSSPMEKPAMKSETQAQPMATSKPEMQPNTGQSQKAESNMMKSTSKTAMMSKQEVKAVQTALNKDGYNLKVDGIYGHNTRSAIKNFQKKNDLKVTGRLDSGTLSKLNVSSAG